MKTTLRFLPLFTALFTLACGVDATVETESFEAASDAELAEIDAALTRNARFETFVGRDGQHYFALVAGNGEKVLASEGYSSASSAQNGIASVKANGVTASRYLVRETSDGAWYFVLTAANGEIIGVGEMYASVSNVNRAIASVVNVVKATVANPVSAPAGAKFETFRGLDGKYYFHVRARNGEIILQSQGYTTRTAATNGIASVQTNGTNPARYSVVPAADGKYYFFLKAANGQKIARGETYASKYNAERGVQTVINTLTVDVGAQ